MNFISESGTNLCARTWHSAVVKVEQPSEVQKDALRSFRAQEALELASRSDLTLKHKIESLSLAEVVVSLWCFKIVSLNAFINLLL